MKNLSKILILMTLTLACGKKDDSSHDHSHVDQNTQEIQKLEADLTQSQQKYADLEKQLKELLEQKIELATKKSDENNVNLSEDNSQKLNSLRAELMAKIEAQSQALKEAKAELNAQMSEQLSQIESRFNERFNSVETKYETFTNKLSDLENSYVNIEDFKVALNRLDQVKLEQQDLLELKRKHAESKQEREQLTKEISQIKADRIKSKTEYKALVQQAISSWQEELAKKIEASDKKTGEVKAFVTHELQRIVTEQKTLERSFNQITQESTTLKSSLADLKTKLQDSLSQRAAIEVDAQNATSEQQEQILVDLQAKEEEMNLAMESLNQKLSRLDQEREFIKSMGVENKQALAAIKTQINNFNSLIKSGEHNGSPIVIDSIIRNIYSICTNSLKEDPYCYTNATIINRLGGKLVDPKDYSRTKEDVIKYYKKSGVNIKSVLDYPSSFMVPGSAVNKSRFQSCHGDSLRDLTPPKKYWHKGVVLALLMEEIEKRLIKEKMLKLQDQNTVAMLKVISWWRTQCYHDKIKNNGKSDNKSDHLKAAAFDLQFKNIQSHKYYVNFIKENVIKNDIYKIVNPLESSDKVFTFGFGTGNGTHGNGKMHIGIGSHEASRWGKRIRQWRY